MDTHSDDRGFITDIFVKKNMNHACLIKSWIGAVRGNHYHKMTTQYTYIISGEMEYYWRNMIGSDSSPVQSRVIGPGDLVMSDPFEIHAMKCLSPHGCTFIAFAEGPRGGEEYESDTFRVPSIIPDE